MTQDETLQAVLAELAHIRTTLAQQQDLINELQQRNGQSAATQADAPSTSTVARTPDVASSARSGNVREGTSRRSLLRGAAAATAAATVGAVALGATEQAHAAPLADGGNLILGQSNSASSQTALTDSASTAQYMFQVSSGSNATANAAIHGTAPNGAAGVLGDTSAGYGVWGKASGGTAVYGTDGAGGTGVRGVTTQGIAVIGDATANGGWGVLGSSRDSYDLVSNGTGLIYQTLQGAAGAPSGTFAGGESIRDSNGDLWLCLAPGVPGTWVKVAHLAPGATTGGAITYLSKPTRLFDSRPGATAYIHPGTRCAANTSTAVQVAGDSYNGVIVPAALAGAIGNVTVLNGTGAGFVEIVPSGAGFTGAANLAFAPGQVISNAFNVGLSSGGALDIYVGGAGVDVIIDLFAVVA